MLFSSSGPLALALAACSAVTATPHALAPVEARTLGLSLGDLSKPTSVDVSLDADLSGLTLVEGVLVNAVVDPLAAVGADVDLIVKCNKGYVKGDINATVSVQELVPALSLSLKDIEAELDLDLYVGVATTIAVNLFAPVDPIKLPIAGLEISALVYVDLVLSLDAAIDVTAGLYVKLTEEALLEIDILKGEILTADFSGLAVKTLPIEVRIGCARLQADLRIRVQAGIAAEVDLDDLLPLGLDIPEIGAGVELGVYANLVEYVGFFCDTPSCPLSKESYGLNVGVAAELDVEVEDLISLSLAPTVSVALLTLPTATHCSQSGGHTVSTLPHPGTGSTATGGLPSASASASFPGHAGHGATDSYSVGPSVTGSATASYGSGKATSSNDAATGSITATSGVDLVTSTVLSTTVYTITSCAASVANCPASYQSSQTVVKTIDYTTVCPVSASVTAPASYSTSAAPKPTSSDVTVVTDVTTLVPCSSTATFTPPANVTPYPSKPTSAVSPSATYPAGGETGSKTFSVSIPTSMVSKPTTYPTVSASSPTGGASTKTTEVSTHPVGTTTYPAGGASTKTTEVASTKTTEVASTKTTEVASTKTTEAASTKTTEVASSKSTETCSETTEVASTYPAGGASTYPAGGASTQTTEAASTKPATTYPAGGASTYPAGGASTYPAGGASTYPAGSASTKPTEAASTSPVSYPGSSEAPYPTYPAGGKPGSGSGYGNATVPCPTSVSSTYSAPSASLVYSTKSSSAPTYPASTPSTTSPVTAGANKVLGSGVAGAVAVAALIAMI
ncbi:hypothetical protein SCUP234_03762 [Seiridium cupressi]